MHKIFNSYPLEVYKAISFEVAFFVLFTRVQNKIIQFRMIAAVFRENFE